MALPPGVAAYGEPAYWEARFIDEESYEWCGAWEGGLADAVRPALATAKRVLILGVGTSSLPFALADEGDSGRLPLLEEVVATDISPTAVAKLQARIAARRAAGPQPALHPSSPARPPVALSAVTADMLALTAFPASSFDAVVEKGTFDVLECAGSDGRAPDPWRPPPEVSAKMHSALGEAHRVLRPDGGTLVSITWAPPLFRRGHYLDDPRYDWGGPDSVVGGVGGAVPVLAYTLARGVPAPERARWARARPGEVGDVAPAEGLPGDTEHGHMDDEDAFLAAIGGSDGESE